jgi:hypothetical protein
MTDTAAPGPTAPEDRKMTFGEIQPSKNGAAPAAPPAAKTRPQQGRRATEAEAEEIRTRREALIAKARAEQEGPAAPDLTPPAAPREDVESVELQMPDGKVVTFGPPPGISLMLRTSQILGPAVADLMLNAVTRTLLCVRVVDGKAPAPLRTAIDVHKASLMWGDAGLNYLTTVYAKYWPAVSVDDLPVLKKNLRES